MKKIFFLTSSLLVTAFVYQSCKPVDNSKEIAKSDSIAGARVTMFRDSLKLACMADVMAAAKKSADSMAMAMKKPGSKGSPKKKPAPPPPPSHENKTTGTKGQAGNENKVVGVKGKTDSTKNKVIGVKGKPPVPPK